MKLCLYIVKHGDNKITYQQEKKKELVESGEIDCIMGCFSMEGRLGDYRWVGPRILEEPLMITGIGVAFAKDDDRGICEQMNQTLKEMRQDGIIVLDTEGKTD